ncbi:IclR family transcriptional regulator [Georgenia sunbinii]|uniref:IclR family transcriptional regulator n=1 Tax=Georgenia sunbinii TaxID=3117728 RepID=UPI002F2649D3
MAVQPTLINSVVRALNLLDVVGAAESPQPAKKLARIAGIPLGTAYHLLRTLVHEGYLVRTPEGYVLGDRVDSLGQGAETRRVRQVLHQLHDKLRAAAYLAALDDGEIRLTEIVDSPAAPRTDLWVGFHDAAHATALGKAMLAALPEESRREYVAAHPLVDLTPHTVTSPRALMEEVARAGQLAVDHEEYALGVMCAAVPVPGLAQAVAVSVPARRAGDVVARADELRRAARLIALARG